MPDFAHRSADLEVMDDLTHSGAIIDQTLRELEFINSWLGGNQVTLNGLTRLTASHDKSKPLRVADLGCGGGDMLRLINRWAKRNNFIVELIGIDANPDIIRYAKNNLADLQNVHLEVLDIFSDAFKQLKFDVVIGTLFYHHFSETQLTAFFGQLKGQLTLGFIINDIHRHPLAYHSIRYLTKWFSKSPMVIHDAPLSVLRAFHKKELVRILESLSLKSYSIQWRWAFRWQVVARV